MKISRSGLIPQFELGPRLGGLKMLYQRSGIIARMITMLSAMTAAWSTTPILRNIFGSFTTFVIAAAIVLVFWMAFDYIVLLPSEQNFIRGQAERSERSPVKRDTEAIIEDLEKLLEELDN